MALRLVSLRSLFAESASVYRSLSSPIATAAPRRFYADNAGPNGGDALPGVNEEAQKIGNVVGGGQPEVSEQGTPVGEVINRDPAAKEHAPEVYKNNADNMYGEEALPPPPVVEVSVNGGRTMYRSETLAETHNYPNVFFPVPTQTQPNPEDPYGLPKLPLPGTYRMTDRYVPIVEQVTNMIMEHGMKAKAQANMFKILGYLRTKPMPKPSAKYQMIAGSPPLSTLPNNPIAYLQTAIDSIAPLVKLKSVKGSGGFSNTVPVPLNQRQRRRTAIKWILDAVAKRVPGPIRFPEKFAEEIIAVVEGRSKAWEKRMLAHKTAVASRANVKTGTGRF